MGPLDLLLHLLNFMAPALAVALGVAACARLVLKKSSSTPGLAALVAINSAVGVAVLGAGLALFGHDGKMATYAALVAACAVSQWLAGRHWR